MAIDVDDEDDDDEDDDDDFLKHDVSNKLFKRSSRKPSVDDLPTQGSLENLISTPTPTLTSTSTFKTSFVNKYSRCATVHFK